MEHLPRSEPESLMDFYAIPRLSIMNTLFKNEVAHNCTFYKGILCQRSRISFVTASSDLWLMFWSIGKERFKAVNRSSLGGELCFVAQNVGQIYLVNTDKLYGLFGIVCQVFGEGQMNL